MKKPVALIIRDGWGISPNGRAAAIKEGNAPLLAKVPFHDGLYATYPGATLSASGLDVGLPEGQMGNSEVGHLNLGAGRIVYQDLTRINKSIADGEFIRLPALTTYLQEIKARGGALHLWGLLSDGGVHSHQEHLYALLIAAKAQGLTKVYVHAFLDGRDTSPTGGVDYLRALQQKLKEIGVGQIATMIGRYFAMDRDKRWERVQQAYELIFDGKGEEAGDAVAALQKYYAAGKTDEFIPATALLREPRPLIQDGDGIFFFNFRADRTRQLCQVLLEPAFAGFPLSRRPKVTLMTLTEYDATYHVPILFSAQSMEKILGEVVSQAGLTQLRMAETEKYPHVTYFFNGGREEPFAGEDREMAASPKVATYDLQPAMSAPELTEKVLAKLKTGTYDLLILNFANPDMVGHTGVLEAAIAAVETIDRCVEKVVAQILAMGGCALITADHGNCERMKNDDGSPNTAHTTNLVHLIYVGADHASVKLQSGILADIAPSLLDLLGQIPPVEMTGHSLISRLSR